MLVEKFQKEPLEESELVGGGEEKITEFTSELLELLNNEDTKIIDIYKVIRQFKTSKIVDEYLINKITVLSLLIDSIDGKNYKAIKNFTKSRLNEKGKRLDLGNKLNHGQKLRENIESVKKYLEDILK